MYSNAVYNQQYTKNNNTMIKNTNYELWY
jgi:hypothetical protein